MTDTKTSALPAVAALSDAVEFPVNESGASKKVTAAQIRAYAGVVYANSLVTPSLSTQQNDFSPLGYIPGRTNYIELTLAANVTFTGWASPGIDGFTQVLWNGTVFSALFTHLDPNSVNQFVTPGGIINSLGPNSGAIVRWNGTLSKWTFLS